ncbi:uncharacterized protein V2V93DRAFT_365836 [Kockiozyma suomiensis]|uniref:uncharacterized protein n=1 Tax=Kockiozyma suomiensis TaxID=1337062 RepID=UPI003343ADBE
MLASSQTERCNISPADSPDSIDSPACFSNSVNTPLTPCQSSEVCYQSVPIFIPEQSSLPPCDILGEIVIKSSDPNYLLYGHEIFRPKFSPAKICIVPASNQSDEQSALVGYLCYVLASKLSILDAWEEEGHSKSRMPCLITDRTGDEFILADVYMWNGNSTLGEYEYA